MPKPSKQKKSKNNIRDWRNQEKQRKEILEVIHYESPNKRKLRIREDEVLMSIQGNLSSVFFNTLLEEDSRSSAQSHVSQEIGTVDRLLMSNREKEMRMTYLRKKVRKAK